MDDYKTDDLFRLKKDYDDFIKSTKKPLTREELDKLYDDMFKVDAVKDSVLLPEEFTNRINDIDMERKNMDVETVDTSLYNFIQEQEERGGPVNLNDLFEYVKLKSESYSLINSQPYTLDALPGYSNNFSSFIDDTHYDSNLYSNVSDGFTNDFERNNFNLNNFNSAEFNEWKNNKKTDTKMTDQEMKIYLDKRSAEQEQIFIDVDKHLADATKRQEAVKFFNEPEITEKLEEMTKIMNSLQIGKLDANAEVEPKTEFETLKYSREKSVVNNIKKREFK
jgi:hypothetical protein